MSMNRLQAVPIIAGLALTVAACGGHESRRAGADLSAVESRLAPVEKTLDARTIEVYGIVQPSRQSFVSGRVMGPVVAIHVRAGDAVEEGHLLLEIEPDSIDGQVAQAQGALAQAQAALSLAEKNFRRFEKLHAENAASALELDMARMQHEQAAGAVRQAEGAVQAASSVAKESGIRAPFPARVVDTLVEVGDLAAPGRPLVRLESLSGRQIWLTVREADIQRVRAGGTLDVGFDSMPSDRRFKGTVDEIVPAADPATHTFTVKVGVEGVEVASGSSGRGYLTGDSRERLVVPASAVHLRGGLELVVIRGSDGLARTRAVTTGARLQDGRIEILSGLKEGDEALIDALGPAPDGTPVEVQE
jgi:RND family efflux transporter MFP subunit